MSIRKCCKRTVFQIIAVIIGALVFYLGECLYLTVATTLSFGEAFAILNSGTSMPRMAALLVFGGIVLFGLNVLLGHDNADNADSEVG